MLECPGTGQESTFYKKLSVRMRRTVRCPSIRKREARTPNRLELSTGSEPVAFDRQAEMTAFKMGCQMEIQLCNWY